MSTWDFSPDSPSRSGHGGWFLPRTRPVPARARSAPVGGLHHQPEPVTRHRASNISPRCLFTTPNHHRTTPFLPLTISSRYLQLVPSVSSVRSIRSVSRAFGQSLHKRGVASGGWDCSGVGQMRSGGVNTFMFSGTPDMVVSDSPQKAGLGFMSFFLEKEKELDISAPCGACQGPREDERSQAGSWCACKQRSLARLRRRISITPSWWENHAASQRGCRVRMAGSTHLKPDGQALLGAVVDEHTLLGFVAEEALDAVPHLLERACQIAAVHLQVRPATRSSDQVPGIRTESGPRTCKARQPASQPASQRFSCHAQDAALPRLL